ncbi:MAG: ABC transporter ATP-binding protein [Actinomycetota bacterium]|nr:ABC transporter ATP-binding protein [Actinomycetota bacterium]
MKTFGLNSGDSRSGTGKVQQRRRPVPRIDISGLTKNFGQKTAVNSIDFTVEPGQFVVLLGPSGSGKSTLLRCLAGIERPTDGQIRFDDLVVDGPGCHVPPEHRNLAMVFQDYALWPHLSAEQNVAFALQRLGISSEERRRMSLEMLEQVGLGSLSKRYPSQLSGGEQQRVGLARALVANPGVLLFDEPLSNLDADRRERLRIDIGAMVRRNGASAVYITHDQAEAFALADIVGVLNGGRLVQAGKPEEIYRSPVDAFVARFTGLAGELSGKVVSQGKRVQAGLVAVEIEGFLIYGKPILGRSFQPGLKVQVLIRPSAIRFVEQGAGKVDLDNSKTGFPSSQIEATILDGAFRGWGYEHAVAVGAGSRLNGVPADRRIPFMSRVLLELFSEGCLVIAEDSAGQLGEPCVETAQAGESNDFERLQYLSMLSDF